MKILVTGGFGFIGSSLIKYLNFKNQSDIDICEPRGAYESKWQNVVDLKYNRVLDVDYFNNSVVFDQYDAVVHLGANSATTQSADAFNWENNISFSTRLIKRINNSSKKPVIIFASSAAVYGNETVNFAESNEVKPTNFYGFTKLRVEKELQELNSIFSNIYFLRFFNVYGGREQHKGGMASPIYRWLTSSDSSIELFESLNPNFPQGQMKRDFIHVIDVCKVICHCIDNRRKGDIYNVGTGVATSWEDVAQAVFKTKGIADGKILYKKMPVSLINNYQYYTCANIDKLRNQLKYEHQFLNIEEGVKMTYDRIKEIYGNV
jgi:ADP-L-glycero-D-manno-heptose 6-epimerase